MKKLIFAAMALLAATSMTAQKIYDHQRIGGQAKGYTFKTNKVLGYVYDRHLRYYFLGGDSLAVNTFDSETLEGSITIPATITYNKKKYRIVKLKDCAFEKQYYLDSITLPPSIKHIPATCFYWCNHLKHVEAPGLESIGPGSFRYTRLKRVIIPDGVKRIYHDAFIQCTDTKYVELPESVTELGNDAFGYCNHIDTVKVHYPHPIKFNERAFWTDAELHQSNMPRQRIVLLCPKGTKEEYKNAEGWKYFWDFIEY